MWGFKRETVEKCDLESECDDEKKEDLLAGDFKSLIYRRIHSLTSLTSSRLKDRCWISENTKCLRENLARAIRAALSVQRA